MLAKSKESLKTSKMNFDLSKNGSTVTLGIISDTHAYMDPTVLRQVQHCDAVVHAGDICDGVVLDELTAVCETVIAVTGNNDHEHVWPEEQHAVVNALPEVATIDLPGGVVVVEHGHRHGMHKPCHSSLRATHPDARIIVYGHTHESVWDTDTSPWVVNPGAAGNTRTQGGPGCAILSASEKEWHLEFHRFTT
ncbi:MAG: metallophosphatase family protein [Gammaproteobacteria bacterium]|nr:metallophosphatase family protein [Gammaproteobacteria bacterium]